MRLRSRLAMVCLLGALLTSACSGGTAGAHQASASPATQEDIIYTAIGASESVGLGSLDPTHDAWPQVFFRTALPESAVAYNFGIPGATVATALSDELPNALAVKPNLVTVWLNVNDLIAGVSPSAYEGELDQLVRALRRGGASHVLVANTPYLDRLPAYLACRRGAPTPGLDCKSQVIGQTAPAELDAAVGAYNDAIARVVAGEGATLVDLHSQGEVPDLHPDWVSSDGFHPSTAGYAAIAAAFAAAFKNARSGQP